MDEIIRILHLLLELDVKLPLRYTCNHITTLITNVFIHRFKIKIKENKNKKMILYSCTNHNYGDDIFTHGCEYPRIHIPLGMGMRDNI